MAVAEPWDRIAKSNQDLAKSLTNETKAREQEAEARLEAERKARIATSRQLASLSVSERGTRLDRSVLLAVAALKTENTSAARDSLRQALSASVGVSYFLHLDEGELVAVAFSPDGKRVAAGYRRGVEEEAE